MRSPTSPFHFGIFWHAMIALLGREPDRSACLGWEGYYEFRYEPRDAAEGEKFEKGAGTLAEWLNIFELTPIRSRCEYGRLPHPQKDEEGKDYLHIKIVHPVEKKEAKP